MGIKIPPHEGRLSVTCRLPGPLVREMREIAETSHAKLTEVVEVLLVDGMATRRRLLKSKTAVGSMNWPPDVCRGCGLKFAPELVKSWLGVPYCVGCYPLAVR